MVLSSNLYNSSNLTLELLLDLLEGDTSLDLQRFFAIGEEAQGSINFGFKGEKLKGNPYRPLTFIDMVMVDRRQKW